METEESLEASLVFWFIQTFNFLASLINGNTGGDYRQQLRFSFNFLASLINGNCFKHIRNTSYGFVF